MTNPLIETFKRDREEWEKTEAAKNIKYHTPRPYYDNLQSHHIQSFLNFIAKLIEECEGRKKSGTRFCGQCAKNCQNGCSHKCHTIQEMADNGMPVRKIMEYVGLKTPSAVQHYLGKKLRIKEVGYNSALQDIISQLTEFREYLLKENN